MVQLRILESDHAKLQAHLFPGDGLEAIAFALCGRIEHDDKSWLLVHEVIPHPYDKCIREVDKVSWQTIDIESILEKASDENLALVKFHSHPSGYNKFSKYDDLSDESLFDAVFGWVNNSKPHASVVMLPNGDMFGREILPSFTISPIKSFYVIGEELKWIRLSDINNPRINDSNAFIRNEQTFGPKTTSLLKQLKIGVIGCSGTGSPVIEQIVRLGVGTIVLVDPDRIKPENLNRIIGSTLNDAIQEEYKVKAIKRNIEAIGLETKVIDYEHSIRDKNEIIDELSTCDFIFGCVDSIEGRHYLNLISQYYLVPIIDIGVKLVAKGQGDIESINANIHYYYPGIETLLERKVYTIKQLEEEAFGRVSPEEHKARMEYFDNIEVESPAVISVNMLAASLAVNEFLSRIHPFRYRQNKSFSQSNFSLCEWEINTYHSKKSNTSTKDNKCFGRGKVEPILGVYE